MSWFPGNNFLPSLHLQPSLNLSEELELLENTLEKVMSCLLYAHMTVLVAKLICKCYWGNMRCFCAWS